MLWCVIRLGREVGVLLVPRVRAWNVLVGRGRVDEAQHRGSHQPNGGSGQGADGPALRFPFVLDLPLRSCVA